MGFQATLRRTRRLVACLPLLCALAAVPTAAAARSPRGGSGGTGLGGSGSSTTKLAPAPTRAAPGGVAPNVVRLGGVVDASGDGITFTVAASGTLGRPLTITGGAPASDAGALIDIESTRPGRANWKQVATATIGSGGSFSAEWTPSASGQVALRGVLASANATSSSGSAGLAGAGVPASAAAGELATSPLTIPIFKDAVATLYGPGFWGHHTACGERLTRATLGIASRTLRCGTQVAVFYRGRELTVPVIDRGPFTKLASWDLTMATARALGITETATIGTLATRRAPALAVRG